MIKNLTTFLYYILIFFNFNLSANDEVNKLKIGLLAPFSGEYKNLGDSILLSTQMALEEINDKNIIIIPRDSGSNNKIQLIKSIDEIIDSGVKIIIGPMDSTHMEDLKIYKDVIFISLSNKEPRILKNVISIGISLESQIKAIQSFIKKQNKTKTIIIYPKNEYEEFVDSKIKSMNLKNYKIFKYNPDPKLLTGEIEKLTNYSQRKRNLESRKKILEKEDDDKSKIELELLEQQYTLGNVNFDSIIIIDFGNSLKSVLASLVFTDVDDNKVLYTTVNQWFDKSIFYENNVKNLYFPSVNFQNFKKYNNKFFKTFGIKPNEVTILAYDTLGLIYYVWKKNGSIDSINDFLIKDKIKGKIGTFQFDNNQLIQELKIYKTEQNKFKEF
jgi:ABC-type branched-subunit amino acid transport system substrate-binding protein